MANDLLSIIDPFLEKALKMGVDEIEFYIEKQKINTAFIESTKLKSATANNMDGIGIRVLKNGSIGFSSINSFKKEKIENSLQKAIAFAKLIPSQESYSLPDKKQIIKTSNIYDENIANFKTENCITIGDEILKKCNLIDSRINIESGTIASFEIEKGVLSSKNICLSEEKTGFMIELGGMAVEGNRIGSWDEEYNTFVKAKDIDIDLIIEEFSRKLLQNLETKKIKPFVGKAILSPEATRSLFSMVIDAAKASNIQSNASFLKDKIGENIANEKLTIIDDGLKSNSFASSSFDREGLPRQKCTIIENGIFRNTLHNSYTANKENTDSTGHASGDYRTIPEISPTNIEIKSGTFSLEEMIAETKSGILFNRISASPDPISGDFAAVLKGGRLIENSKIKNTLREITAVGNLFECLKTIRGISKENKSLNYYTSWKIPYILLDDINYIS
ncbi:MAG: TldD/PmbA family protein [Candidatus Heimdallarchaeota archaeon]|nr:TldD/PmbA family protein [Candidatus Heimdallarchaeota archaeon]